MLKKYLGINLIKDLYDDNFLKVKKLTQVGKNSNALPCIARISMFNFLSIFCEFPIMNPNSTHLPIPSYVFSFLTTPPKRIEKIEIHIF